MKRILSTTYIIFFAFLFISCGPTVTDLTPSDDVTPEKPPEEVTNSPEPLTEIYLEGYVTVFLPVQESGKAIYSHEIKFTFDANNTPVKGDYKLIHPVIELYISHNKDGGDEIFKFSPPIKLTIMFNEEDINLAKFQNGASPADSIVIAIYDKNEGMWIPQEETQMIDNGNGTWSGVVMISSWTSGAAWVCRGNACSR